MKRILATLLSVVLVFALCIPAFAAEANGTITIDNAVENQVYAIYQIAALESYEASSGSYSYKPVAAWNDFLAEQNAYFQVVDGYLTVKEGVELTDAQRVQLAKDALAYAKAQGIAAADSKTADASGCVEFSSLELGYYLVDSTLGTLCNLTTTDPDAQINEKNEEVIIDKLVKEDSNSQWQETNDADFYQVVEFKTTITAKAGAQNYELHDKMTGLDLDADSIKIYLNGEEETNIVNASNYTLTTAAAALTDGCTFEIKFTDAFCDTLVDNDQIIVTYEAKLNENSVIAGDGNPNETWLTYGENSGNSTTHEFTTTYVYEFDLIKTDAENKLLDGAEFKLYDAAEGGNEILVVKEADGTYRLAKEGESGEAIVVTGGSATITGLDGGTTYYLEETVAPEGYNKLSSRKAFTIDSSNLKATYDQENDNAYQPGTGVQIVNKTGSVLPETGGFGTVLFTLIGSILIIGAGILLVTKKRMSNIAD